MAATAPTITRIQTQYRLIQSQIALLSPRLNATANNVKHSEIIGSTAILRLGLLAWRFDNTA